MELHPKYRRLTALNSSWCDRAHPPGYTFLIRKYDPAEGGGSQHSWIQGPLQPCSIAVVTHGVGVQRSFDPS